MEDASTSLERDAEAVVVEDVGAAQDEPLLRSIQGKQVGILPVRFTINRTITPIDESVNHDTERQ